MEFAFKVTTHGRRVLLACADLPARLEITRVLVGGGTVPEGTELADVHQLLRPVAEGTMAERRHEDDRFYLTVQYTNADHPEVPTFYLAEYIVYALDPDTGEETDLLYATLGDYLQPVPAGRPGQPPCTYSYPMVITVAGEVDVNISASPGLATWDALQSALEAHDADQAAHTVRRHTIATRVRDPTLPGYGLGGDQTAALLVAPYSGTAEVAAVVSGIEYDAQNMRTDGENLPDGTLILTKMED